MAWGSYRHSTRALPMYPFGHLQTAPWFLLSHSALIPQTSFRWLQGSSQTYPTHARLSGQSLWLIHSPGRHETRASPRKPSGHVQTGLSSPDLSLPGVHSALVPHGLGRHKSPKNTTKIIYPSVRKYCFPNRDLSRYFAARAR